MDTHSELIWNKVMSLKVSLFAWKIINNRITTKDNLIRRGVTHSNSLCVGGCGQEETINHLFMDCEFFSGNW